MFEAPGRYAETLATSAGHSRRGFFFWAGSVREHWVRRDCSEGCSRSSAVRGPIRRDMETAARTTRSSGRTAPAPN
jgi:hypothetical protein